MSRELIETYFNELSDDAKNKLYTKARQLIAKRINEDEDFLETFEKIASKFRTVNDMIDAMIEDAVDANLDIEELPEYANIWIEQIEKL